MFCKMRATCLAEPLPRDETRLVSLFFPHENARAISEGARTTGSEPHPDEVVAAPAGKPEIPVARRRKPKRWRFW